MSHAIAINEALLLFTPHNPLNGRFAEWLTQASRRWAGRGARLKPSSGIFHIRH
jgi:hypothetical protein